MKYRKVDFQICRLTNQIDVKTLTFDQRLAYDIVDSHVKLSSEQLLVIITGKSYIINVIQNLLCEKCIVLAFFGIAAFNIKGSTLHSILQLPIGPKKGDELKGEALMKLQEDLRGIEYIIIDEFSVVGQNMFGWINSRCRQAIGLSEKTFGGINVILVGDIGQLPPVSDRVLYLITWLCEINLTFLHKHRIFLVKSTGSLKSTGT